MRNGTVFLTFYLKEERGNSYLGNGQILEVKAFFAKWMPKNKSKK